MPLFEAIMNAYQAIQDASPRDGEIIVNVLRESTLGLPGIDPSIDGFVITDNGIGFNDRNMESFNTAYSELKFSRGGKGLGRFLWLKAFEKVEINSFFSEEGGECLKRDIVFHDQYSLNDDQVSETDRLSTGTSVSLLRLRDRYKAQCPSDIEHIALKICEHFVLVLMHEDCPRIVIRDGKNEISINDLFADQFTTAASVGAFTIGENEFSIHGFRIYNTRTQKHRIIYCAHDRAVMTENIDKFLPNFRKKLVDDEDKAFVYLAVVRGDFLDRKVNNERTSFDISDESFSDDEQDGLFREDVRPSEIRHGVLDFIDRDLGKIIESINDQKKRKIVDFVESKAPHYKILLKDIDSFIEKIPMDSTQAEMDSFLHGEYYKKEVALKQEGNQILEGSKLRNYEDYRDRISTFLKDQNALGVAALAQHVAHRKIILDLFRKALSIKDNDKYPLEKVVHDLIFPMSSSTDDTLISQQNLWVIDERLNYHSFVSSDKPLKSVDSTINSQRRPDLLAFNRKFTLSEGKGPLTSLTIIEFKRPMRDDYTDEDNPLRQVALALTDIRSGGALDDEGRPIKLAGDDIPTNCFIICDITPRLKMTLGAWDAMPMPGGDGYYGYNRTYKMYFEVISYDKLILDAEKRNQILFDKLKLL